jgi:hypothetical protein
VAFAVSAKEIWYFVVVVVLILCAYTLANRITQPSSHLSRVFSASVCNATFKHLPYPCREKVLIQGDMLSVDPSIRGESLGSLRIDPIKYFLNMFSDFSP